METKYWIFKLILLNLNERTDKKLLYQHLVYIFAILGSQIP